MAEEIQNTYADHKGTWWAILSTIYAGVAMLFIFTHINPPPPPAGQLHPERFGTWGLAELAVIIIGPPLWVLAEYRFLHKGKPDEKFRYDQELASRVWAAVSAFALALVLGK